MPCNPEEEFAQGPELPNPAMPTDSSGNAGAGHDEPDAENAESGSDLEAPQKRKRSRTILSYEVVKHWVTGDRAELTEDEIKAELAAEATKLMELSGQKKFPCHRPLCDRCSTSPQLSSPPHPRNYHLHPCARQPVEYLRTNGRSCGVETCLILSGALGHPIAIRADHIRVHTRVPISKLLLLRSARHR